MGGGVSRDKVYVVIVNWNGWRDTVECLESVLRSDHGPCQVVVCDNQSADGSAERIVEWASGDLAACSTNSCIAAGSTRSTVTKPVAVTRLTRAGAESGGSPADAQVVLVENGANMGFAGGTNVGLRYAMARGDCKYAWLLNNDTVVDAAAMRALVERCSADSRIGMVGSTLRYYHRPDRIQAQGGATYQPWLAAARHLGVEKLASEPHDSRVVEREMSYVVGASMLVSVELLHRVGLLSEDYFLYFEELDLALRAKGTFACAFAPLSIVYHKEGATMGSSGAPTQRSVLADYYLLRNRIVVTWRYFPVALPTVYAGLAAAAVNRALRGQWSRLWLVALAALGPLAPLRPKFLTRPR
jgi:GT2 family glycosyltransferase